MRKGYVTVYFSIVLGVCMSLFLALTGAVRENALRMRSKEAMGIAMVSEFAEYVPDLWEDYGLVFVDAGYGAKIDSMILAEDRFRECMNANFDETAPIPVMGKDLLRLKCTAAETRNVRFATDEHGLSIMHQAAEYMHYHSNMEYVMDLYEALTEVRDLEFTGTGLADHIEPAMEALKEYTGDYEIARWTDWAGDAVVSDKDVSPVTVLALVMPMSQVSSREISLDACVSHRELNKGNYEKGEAPGALDSILFKEYLIEKNGDYIDRREGSALAYETEYLIAGKSSDAKNLAGIVHRILLIREAANFERIYNDREKMALIRLITKAIALIMAEPEAAEPMAAMIAAAWAYYESIKDAKVLLGGGRVPFLKEDRDFYTDVYGGMTGNVEEKGLSYKDYLRAFVLAADNRKLNDRFMDLLETNIRNKPGNRNFRLDLCFDALAVRAFVTSGYGYDYELERNMDLWGSGKKEAQR